MADRPGDPDALLVRHSLALGHLCDLSPDCRSCAADAALDRIEARLSEAEAALPDTFYAHLLLPDRVRNMVAGWQKAIEVVNELEARLSVCEQALRAIEKRADSPPSYRIARAALATEPGHPATSE